MKSGRGFYDWDADGAAATVERRDRQIVRELRNIRETGGIE